MLHSGFLLNHYVDFPNRLLYHHLLGCHTDLFYNVYHMQRVNRWVEKVHHIKDAVFHMQASGIQVVAATEKTENTLYDADFTLPTAIIMGSEDVGISPSILKVVDQKAKLPLLGEIQSLNVSVACGAFLYEVVRQRM